MSSPVPSSSRTPSSTPSCTPPPPPADDNVNNIIEDEILQVLFLSKSKQVLKDKRCVAKRESRSGRILIPSCTVRVLRLRIFLIISISAGRVVVCTLVFPLGRHCHSFPGRPDQWRATAGIIFIKPWRCYQSTEGIKEGFRWESVCLMPTLQMSLSR